MYATKRDFIDFEIIPTLGEYVDDFDVWGTASFTSKFA